MSSSNEIDLLKLIRCPVTKSRLRRASKAEIESLNARIEDGTLLNQVGQAESKPIEDGYFNEEGTLLLPVREGIIILVSDQALCV